MCILAFCGWTENKPETFVSRRSRVWHFSGSVGGGAGGVQSDCRPAPTSQREACHRCTEQRQTMAAGQCSNVALSAPLCVNNECFV